MKEVYLKNLDFLVIGFWNKNGTLLCHSLQQQILFQLFSDETFAPAAGRESKTLSIRCFNVS